MKLLTILCFLQISLVAISQEKEDDIINNHLLLFNAISRHLENIDNKHKALVYVDSTAKTISNEYIKNHLRIIRANLYESINLKTTFTILDTVKGYTDRHTNFIQLKIHHNIVKGKAYYAAGKFKESLKSYLEFNDDIFNYSKGDDLWNFTLETKIGIISNYAMLNRNEEAITLLKELENEVSTQDKFEEYIYVLNMLGYLHTKSKNYNEGALYFKKILSILDNNKEFQNYYLGACNSLGYIYKKTNKRQEAITVLKKALETTQSMGLISKELLLSVNLGFLLLAEKKYDEAEQLGEDVLEKSRDRFEERKADAERLLAHTNYFNGYHENALEHAESAALFFRGINDLKRLKNVLSIKNRILIKTNNFEAATKVNSEMISLMDSISILTDMQNLQKTLVSYESEKKDNEITILKQQEEIATVKLAKQKEQIIFLIVFIAVLLILGIIIFLYQRKINKITTLALRSKLTRSQFNPHYINNAFTALQAELVEQGFNENLIDYTSSISRFSRLVLESTFKDEWTIKEEKHMIENYLQIQKHRLQNGFQFQITSNLDANDFSQIKIPSAITQSVLENAIEHGGFNTISKEGKIDITLEKLDKKLFILIKNSILKSTQENIKKKGTSRGLSITKQRIYLHGKIYNKEADFKFTRNDYDAEIIFELPIIAA